MLISRFFVITLLAVFAIPMHAGAQQMSVETRTSHNIQTSLEAGLQGHANGAPPAHAVLDDEEKSPGLAVFLSLMGTVVPPPAGGALGGGLTGTLLGTGIGIIAGSAFGPSFGHFYAGNTQRALQGIYIRAGSLAFAGITGLGLMDNFDDDPVYGSLAIGGLAVAGGSILYDIFMAHASAREYNRQLRKENEVSLSPWVSPDGRGGGMSVSVRF